MNELFNKLVSLLNGEADLSSLSTLLSTQGSTVQELLSSTLNGVFEKVLKTYTESLDVPDNVYDLILEKKDAILAGILAKMSQSLNPQDQSGLIGRLSSFIEEGTFDLEAFVKEGIESTIGDFASIAKEDSVDG